MKRFWHTWLAMVAVATMVSTASAQSGSRYTPEIGSYQSILSRAGYGDASASAGYGQAMQAAQSYAQPASPCQSGGCDGGAMMAQPGYAQPGYAQPGYAQQGGNFGYQGGTPTQGYVAPMQQQMSAPVQSYQMSPLPMAPDQGNQVYQGQGGQMVPSSSDPVTSSYDGPCGGSAPAGGYANYAAPSYAPAYSAPAVYSPGSAIGGIGAIAGNAGRRGGSNLVASVSALAFVRDYEDTRLIARNPAGGLLFTNSADHDTIGGVDFALASRKANGNGWEARYFGLFPDNASATLTGAAVSAVGLRGLDRLNYGVGGPSLDTFFGAGTSQTVSRDTDIHNIEFNLLRNGGRFCTRSGRNANFELLGGFRYFQFDEQFTYSTADGTTPIDYVLNAENTLLGLQLGGRGEVCFSNRLRGAGTIKTGIFNNNVNTRQRISDPTGAVFATVPTALDRNFDYSDEKNDVAFLSEIDLGLIYQLSCKARFKVGYRALGIAGVALATDQIPYEFNNTLATESANTNGSLLLHGGYIGTEFCF